MPLFCGHALLMSIWGEICPNVSLITRRYLSAIKGIGMELVKRPFALPRKQRASGGLSKRAARLNIPIANPQVNSELKKQLFLCRKTELKTKTKWVNALLELVLFSPSVVKENKMDDITFMLKVFGGLPMDEIRWLAEQTERYPEQMITRIIKKGLASYASALAKADFD